MIAANAVSAIALLHTNISNKQSTYSDAVQIIVGDFTHADLKTAIPKLHQHDKCATRGGKTMDKIYTNIKMGYRVKHLSHLASLTICQTFAHLCSHHHKDHVATIIKLPCSQWMHWDIFEHQDLKYSQKVSSVT